MKQGRAWNIGLSPAEQCAGFDPRLFDPETAALRRKYTQNVHKRGEERRRVVDPGRDAAMREVRLQAELEKQAADARAAELKKRAQALRFLLIGDP